MTTARDFVIGVGRQTPVKRIKLRYSSEPVEHDETATEFEMHSTCPAFFHTPHGKRETYTSYRGFLIVRNTRQYTGQRPVRCTQIYIYLRSLEGHPDLLYVPFDGNTVKQAERRINRILGCGCVDESRATQPAEKIPTNLS